MKLSTLLLRALALLLLFSVLVCVFVGCGGDDIGDRGNGVDSDGDGIPDDLDKEAEDNTDKDNVVDIGNMSGKN
ncbi:MAG: hypothetical protein IJV96_02815 [Clostridia bacterium]|nr:hypothetical protein [Clostridia bacterium]